MDEVLREKHWKHSQRRWEETDDRDGGFGPVEMIKKMEERGKAVQVFTSKLYSQLQARKYNLYVLWYFSSPLSPECFLSHATHGEQIHPLVPSRV